jgi:hypothetical protein
LRSADVLSVPAVARDSDASSGMAVEDDATPCDWLESPSASLTLLDFDFFFLRRDTA